MIKRFIKYFLILIMLVLIALGLFIVSAVDTKPLVLQPSVISSQDAYQVSNLGIRLYRLTESTEGQGWFSISRDELNSIDPVIARFFPRLSTNFTLGENQLRLQASYQLPYQLWINVSAYLKTAKKGVNVHRIDIGTWDFDGNSLLKTSITLADYLLGQGVASDLYRGINRTKFTNKLAMADINISKSARHRFIQSLQIFSQNEKSEILQVLVEEYWQHIYASEEKALFSEVVINSGGTSFTRLLKASLRHVLLPRVDSSSAPLPVRIQAMLLALAIHCGDVRVQKLIGAIIPKKLEVQYDACAQITLGGRQDLLKHFTISAALRIIETVNVYPIGEFKELLDSNDGGTGFSFDDMAANLAGEKFASRLLTSTRTELKSLINAINSESDFFPRVDDLPSGLTNESFNRKYGDVESSRYQAQIDQLSERIDKLPIFSYSI